MTFQISPWHVLVNKKSMLILAAVTNQLDKMWMS